MDNLKTFFTDGRRFLLSILCCLLLIGSPVFGVLLSDHEIEDEIRSDDVETSSCLAGKQEKTSFQTDEKNLESEFDKTDETPDGLTENEWSGMLSCIKNYDYQISYDDLLDCYHAENNVHGLDVRFGSDGGVKTVFSDENSFSLTPVGFGYNGFVSDLDIEPLVDVDHNKISFDYSNDFVGWYKNSVDGLEQGFDILEPIEPRLNSEVCIEISYDPGYSAKEIGDGIVFSDSSGVSQLKYDKLKVVDAKGSVLPSSMRLKQKTHSIMLSFDDSNAVYPVVVDPLVTSYFKNITNNMPADSYFGRDVDIDGDTFVVGASGKDWVYVFTRNNQSADDWGLVANLTDDDGTSNIDYFGGSVAIFSDTIVVGAYNDDVDGNSSQGSAYVFTRNNQTADDWGQVAKLTASDGEATDRFGCSVSISYDTIVVGAHGDTNDDDLGAAYVFARNQGGTDNWGQVTNLTASDGAADDYFGYSVAISGDTIVVGAPYEDVNDDNNGSAYVFSRNQGGADNWGQVAKLTASDGKAYDEFGQSVTIEYDTIIVGAKRGDGNESDSGAAYVFARNHGGADNWGQVKKIIASDGVASDEFGSRVSISNDVIVVGALAHTIGDNAAQGASYVFVRNNPFADDWGQLTKLTDPNGASVDLFGMGVSISGDTVIIGADGAYNGDNNRAGLVHIFNITGDAWTQISKPISSDGAADDYFGYSVSISGDTCVVGAYWDDVGSNNCQGSAYLFTRNNQTADDWGQVKKLTASDGTALDCFGSSVSISGDTIVIGAYGDDSSKGAAYVFTRNNQTADDWGQVKKLTASDGAASDQFGCSVSISWDTCVLGAFDGDGRRENSGSAYVFSRNNQTADDWGQLKKLTASDGAASDRFGYSVSICGDTCVVGAPYEDVNDDNNGSAYVFTRNNQTADDWGQVKKLTASDGDGSDEFGYSVSISGNKIVIGADGKDSDQGASYIYYNYSITQSLDPPGNLHAATNSTSEIYLTWTAASGADNTTVEYNMTSSSWNRGQGLEIYNGSGICYSHTGLDDNTTYYYQAWSYNATNNEYSTTNASTNTTTDPNIPIITNESPGNQSDTIDLLSSVCINISDLDGDSMTITWYSNSSGSWQIFGTNNSVGNGTYSQNNSNFSSYNTTYYWNVSVNDGANTNNSDIFCFTTKNNNTVYVDDNAGNSWYDDLHVETISEAVTNVSSNGTIYVYNGSYNENVDVTKSVAIIGNSTDGVIVNASISTDYTIDVQSENVTISKMTLTGSTGDNEAGLYCNGYHNGTFTYLKCYDNYCGIDIRSLDNVTVLNCNISNNSADGISLSAITNSTFNSNIINSNDDSGIESGLNCDINVFTNNICSNNAIYGFSISQATLYQISNNLCNNNNIGLFLSSLDNATISNNTCNNNSVKGISIEGYSPDARDNSISNNTCNNNEYGIYLYDNMGGFAINNTIRNNTFSSNDYGIKLDDSTDNLIYNNYFDNTVNTVISGTCTGNVWNTSKTIGANIIGGSYIGGNYWSDYNGYDAEGDGIGDSSNYTINVTNNLYDLLPLIDVTLPPTIEFNTPTPQNNAYQFDHYVTINTSISSRSLDNLTYNWNATNFTMYNESLVLMYNFDNVSGIGENYNGNESTVVDVSGQNNDGSWITNETNETTESVWTNSGIYNGAFSFDGYDDYIDCGTDPSLKPTDNITVDVWIKSRTQENWTGIITNLQDNDDDESGYGLFFYNDSSQINITWWVQTVGGNPNNYEEYPNYALSNNNWFHITGTYDGNNLKLYINGELVGNETKTGNIDWTHSPLACSIGNYYDDNEEFYFDGFIDEPRIWNRTLSAEEVYQQYVSNLRRVNQTHWQLIVNQSKNATTDLDFGSYTYQVFADDMYDNSNSTDQRTITIVNMHAPSSFTGSSTSSSGISLSWTKDTNATHTYIRYKQGSSAPTSRTDGTFLYNNTGSSTSASGLSASTTYSFTAWSWNETGSCYSLFNVTTSATTDQASSSSSPPANPAGPGNTPPVAVASVSSTGSIGASLSFDGSSSSDADGDSLTYKWNYGDGSTGSGSSSSHAYSRPGKFYGYLEVYDGQDRDKDNFVITIVDPDADTDEDGVKDTVEDSVGSNSNETTDVENIDVVVPGGRLIDNDGDGSFDVFYDANNDLTTTLEKSDDGSYGIDSDDDGVIDYYYNPISGFVGSTELEETIESDNTVIILLAVALLILAFLIIVLISRKKKK